MSTFQRIVGAVLAIALFAAAAVFASIILAVAAVLGLLLWGWLMWRTRHVRRAMEQAAQRAADRGDSTVIEGEYRVEVERRDLADDRPREPREG